ncbi:MAG: AIM24 family protein [Blastocatellia bacterium]|nr:AIM24 family protein [Blastocatellia bacterium]
MIYNFNNLPSNDNLNDYSYSIAVTKEMFIRRGKMIAYYGNLKFEALGSSISATLVRSAFNAPSYVSDFVIVTGQGKLILGDNARNIAAYNLEDGNLTVKSSRVLAFEPTLICQECTLPGYLTLLGTGTFLASSNGPVHFMEPPVRVDEQALLGWVDLPCPSYYYDYQYVQGVIGAIGAGLGITSSQEEKQVNFVGQGTVLVQSSELGEPSSALQRVLMNIPGLSSLDLENVLGSINSRLGRQ